MPVSEGPAVLVLIKKDVERCQEPLLRIPINIMHENKAAFEAPEFTKESLYAAKTS